MKTGILAVIALLLLSQDAGAFCTIYMNKRSTSGITRQGATRLGLFEPRSFPVDIYMDGVRPEIGADAWRGIIEGSAARWNLGDAMHPLVYSFEPVTPLGAEVFHDRSEIVRGGDGHNVIVFDDVGDVYLDQCVAVGDHGEDCLDRANLLGVAFTSVGIPNGDVVINGQTVSRVLTEERVIDVEGFPTQIVVVTGIEKTPWTWTTDPAMTEGYDLESVIRHEMGHLLGLDHAGGKSGCREDHPEAVMWGEGLGENEIRRDFDSDDVAGLYFLYEGNPRCFIECLGGRSLDIAPVILDTTVLPDRIQNGEPWYPVSAYILGNRDGEIGEAFFRNRIDTAGGTACWRSGEDFSGEMTPMGTRHHYEFPIPAMGADGIFWPPGTDVHYGIEATSVWEGRFRNDPPDAENGCYQFRLLHPPHQAGEPYFENTGIRRRDFCEFEEDCRFVLHNVDDSVDANWVDYDLDGDLDLHVVNKDPTDEELSAFMFRNDHDPGLPDAFFTDLPAEGGERFPTRAGNNFHKSEWANLPGDDLIDLFGMGQQMAFERVFENTGEVAPFRLVTELPLLDGWHGFTPRDFEIVDFNRDGYLDISIMEKHTGLCEGEYAENGGRSISLFAGGPDGSYEDVTLSAGFVPNAGVGTNKVLWADYDNDGLPDLTLFNECVPSRLFRNMGRGGPFGM